MLLLIQGVFFQEVQMLGIGYSGTEEGVFIDQKIGAALFSGFVALDDLGTPQDGRMDDVLGRSKISEVNYDPEDGVLEFRKEYFERASVSLFYSFQKDGNGIFIGTWTASFGSGLARCIITEVDDSFIKIPAEFQLSLV